MLEEDKHQPKGFFIASQPKLLHYIHYYSLCTGLLSQVATVLRQCHSPHSACYWLTISCDKLLFYGKVFGTDGLVYYGAMWYQS